MSTKTVQTPYGDTTIEVVECDSCGNKVAKQQTRRFTLGERKGRACEHCYDEGPISFPEKVTEWAMSSDRVFALFFQTLFYPIVTPFAIIFAFTDDDEFAQGNAIGIITTLVWVGLAIGIYVAL